MTTDNTPTTAPAPVDPALQQRVALAIGAHRNGLASDGRGWFRNDEDMAECHAIAAAVLAELAPELAELADYRNRITWETTCGEHAALLDACRTADERAEQAETRIAQVLAVAEVIEANGIGWAADSIRAALTGQPAPTPNGH